MQLLVKYFVWLVCMSICGTVVWAIWYNKTHLAMHHGIEETYASSEDKDRLRGVGPYQTLAMCPLTPPNLVGKIEVDKTPLPWDKLHSIFNTSSILPGGRWQPSHCQPHHHVAIVIPYRDRDTNLRMFLAHMHPLLQKQNLNYAIFVIEQADSEGFDRGMLFNIGYMEALKEANYSCFIFSDVDMLPENDRNIYSCEATPRHHCAVRNGVEVWSNYFGGVVSFQTEQYHEVNGFSNVYFSWGLEDDDLLRRLQSHGYKLNRLATYIGRYRLCNHTLQDKEHRRFGYYRTGAERFSQDGVNSLEYKVVRHLKLPLYTLIAVQLNETQVLKKQNLHKPPT